MKKVRTFKYILVYQIISQLEDSYDFEGMMEAGNRHNNLTQKLHRYFKENMPNLNFLVLGAAAYHFENAIKMADMLMKLPNNIVVMGNVDPAGQIKEGTPESVKNATLNIMNECCSYSNFVISSGCDIPPASAWENIDAFFDAVKEFYF